MNHYKGRYTGYCCTAINYDWLSSYHGNSFYVQGHVGPPWMRYMLE